MSHQKRSNLCDVITGADGLKGSVSCRNMWLSIWLLETGSYQAVKDQGKLQVIQANSSEMDETGAHYTEWSKPER